MNLFQKNFVPKKLSIDKMWMLYRTLKDGLVGKQEELLMDEVGRIMSSIDTESFKSSLRQMYGDNLNYLEQTPGDLALMFIRGIKNSGLLEFTDFIKAMSNGNS